MGKDDSRKKKKARVESACGTQAERTVATLRFFYCGRGDTILVEASPGHWGLIDCNLTKSSGAHQQVRDFVKKNVPKLDFVCLTHTTVDCEEPSVLPPGPGPLQGHA